MSARVMLVQLILRQSHALLRTFCTTSRQLRVERERSNRVIPVASNEASPNSDIGAAQSKESMKQPV